MRYDTAGAIGFWMNRPGATSSANVSGPVCLPPQTPPSDAPARSSHTDDSVATRRTGLADSRVGPVCRHIVLGQHGSDVVFRSARQRQIHQRPAPIIERRLHAEDRRNVFVVDDVTQTVGAQQDAILRAQLELV